MKGKQATAGRATPDWTARLRRVGRAAEWLVVTAAIAVIAACLAFLWVLVFDPERGSELTSGLRPIQFYRELEAELLEDYGQVFAVGHNSGDSIEAALTAIRYGADVVEVDVISLDGRLYAAHGTPIRWLGESFFRGPPLDQVWIATAGATAVKLDLKESSPAFHELLLDFLADRRGQRLVIVVSGEPDVLRLVAKREPTVFCFLGAGDGDRLDLIDEDPAFAAIVDGVSIHHSLIDEERAAWLDERGLLTLAWTVNDLERVNELVLLGVDAITTDNLAIMRLLGERERGDLWLQHLLRPPAAPLDEPIAAVEGERAAALSAAGAARSGRGGSRRRRRRAVPTRGGPRRPRRPGAARPGRSWRRRRG